MDPFNRAPMTIKDIVPLPDLKAQIEAWIETKMQQASNTDAAVAVAGAGAK